MLVEGACSGCEEIVPATIDEATEDGMLSNPVKLAGFEFWKTTLRGAKHVVAPMVDQSELAWRLLSRRHGAELCYTPMLNAKIFLEHNSYQQREFQTCPEDHPLIAQFCGHDPEVILQAARRVQDQVEAVDLNLGCPQNIARKGRYGSYLQEEWELIRDIVSTLHRELLVPVTVKIRVFEDTERTLRYAKMIEEAGAQLLTVHGRVREQRGEKTGLADWEKIRLIKEAASIPVFANGNILFKDDIERCLQQTGADGVMTAEGNLYNPAIFKDEYPLAWEMVDEYLNICRHEAPASLTAVRGHLFKMYRPCLNNFVEERSALGAAKSFEELSQVTARINDGLRKKHAASGEESIRRPQNHSSSGVTSPEWFCRSYIRDRSLFASVYPSLSSSVDNGPCSINAGEGDGERLPEPNAKRMTRDIGD